MLAFIVSLATASQHQILNNVLLIFIASLTVVGQLEEERIATTVVLL